MENSNFNIENALSKFRTANDRGYRIANQKYLEITWTLKKAAGSIETANSTKNKIPHIQNNALLSRQNEEIQALQKSIATIRENIATLNEQKDFSIVVFGRALVGKTTLMEILTHGEAIPADEDAGEETESSTARGIRTYYWNGLKIIDIPDFSFFKNAEADQLGMKAAKTADLVLFLLTNEEPQPEEYQCLAQLKILGKSILCILNIKKDLTFKRHDTTLKELKQIFDNKEKIKTLISQFKNSAKKYHQNWNSIKFIPTHLAAAHHAKTKKKFDAEIYTASHFDEVENAILEKVQIDGVFLRVKNFVDSIAVPMNSVLLKLFEHSANALKESKIWTAESKKIKTWRREFWDHSQNKIYELFAKLSENLKHTIPNFVEENYDDKDINKKWNDYIQQYGYIARYKKILYDILAECNAEIKKFGEEFKKDIEVSLDIKSQTNVEIEDIADWGKSSDIALPSLFKLVPNMKWVEKTDDSNQSFFETIFESKAQKIRNKKDNIYKQLTESSFSMLNRLNNHARDIFNKQIMGKVDELSDVLISYSYMLARLAESQSEIAEHFIDQYAELSSVLFVEAAHYKNAGEIEEVKASMRVPGVISVVIAEESTVNMREISSLLGERFFVMKPLKNWESTMRKMLGCDFELEAYRLEVETDDKTYAVVPKGKVSTKRLRLTQQISPYPIMTS